MLAALGVQGLVHLVQQSFPVPGVETVSVDRSVLGFTLLISLATGLLSGLAPALGSSKLDLNEALMEGGRSATGSVHRNRVRSALVVFETSLALVLLSGAGLMVRSLLLLEQVNPGLNPQNIIVLDFSLYSSRYAHTAPRAAFFQQVLDRLRALPGVQAAAVVADIPLGDGVDRLGFTIEGRPKPATGRPLGANFNVVGPGYFQALGIPLLKGRDFIRQDVESAPGVILINDAMARRFWPDTDPIGQRISTDGHTWFTIVGVAADARQTITAGATPEAYLSYLQDPVLWPYLSVLVRTESDPLRMANAIKGVVWSVDKDQPVSNVRTMEQILAQSKAQPRLSALLLSVFATMALILAAVGIYGVMAYSVAQRTHEMGIRMALGAGRGTVLKMVMGQCLLLALIGTAVGVTGSLLLTRLMRTLLFTVHPNDSLTLASVSIILIAVAIAAGLIPAHRATKVDPMIALRYE